MQIQDANGANPDNAAEGLTTRPYLLAIGDVPLVISAFPAGGKRDTLTPMSLLGINLPEGRAPSIGSKSSRPKREGWT